MEYSKLVSVTGLPGLFELVASKADGAIVRSLEDKSTRFVSSRIHNFSHLESIEVYTEGENVNLVDVFHAMQNTNESLPNEKDANAVKSYFEKVYPAMDFTRVYASDMKKMVKWFDVLKKNDIEIKLSEPEEEAEEEPVQQEEEVVVAETKKEAPKAKEEKASKASTKKKVEEEEPATSTEEKPATPKKAKAAKTKKAEAATSPESDPAETETKAAKKKATKK
ncbi:MAG TPA: DUF5606 domain-containing protein [Parafilimonas sp.]|nr:DUF5606 domain-containing protein [Parafilimonas sp.]